MGSAPGRFNPHPNARFAGTQFENLFGGRTQSDSLLDLAGIMANPAGFDAKTQLEVVPFRGFTPRMVRTSERHDAIFRVVT
jgi:hypothetical protein